MTKTVLIGSGSSGKRRFLETFFADLPVRFCGPQDLNIQVDVEESGQTAEENAILKAEQYHAASGLPTLTNDAALYIAGLPDGEQPGVYVRRVHGKQEASDEYVLEHFVEVIEELGGETRGSWEIAYALCWGENHVVSRTFHRETILTSRRVDALNPGAPLNSIQQDPESGRYLAEMGPDEMNQFYRREMGFYAFVEQSIARLP